MADAEEAQRVHDRTAAAAALRPGDLDDAGGARSDGLVARGGLEGDGGGGSLGDGVEEEGCNDPELMCSQLMMEVMT